VAPLDEHDAAVVQEFGQAELGDLAELVEPVDVEVVDRQPARILLRQGEGGAGDGLDYAQPGTEALRERRLARTQVAGEDQQVARLRERGQRGAQLAGLLDRGRPGDQRGGRGGHGTALFD